ncbi:MAG: tRNA pseudouridine(55) synthase TruB [Saprospiraceae bacterium]|nr:tRNA pseudouridine(55) synthase TruB [Saprospiraceae bacterium]
MNGDDVPLPEYDFINGATLLVDKPEGWTSFDVVNKIRYRLKHRLKVKKIKVGHAGTLDPMATGLLIICTGKATKQLHNMQGLDKTYTGTITLGATTPSFDQETAIDETYPIDHIDADLMERTKQQFLGEISQVPPMFSAIKVDGQPLYKKARKGQTVEVQPRKVVISSFDITSIDIPAVDFQVSCSKGTYIRSLANDFGKALQSGAYLSALRRTRVGSYRIEDAWNLDKLIELLEMSPIKEE